MLRPNNKGTSFEVNFHDFRVPAVGAFVGVPSFAEILFGWFLTVMISNRAIFSWGLSVSKKIPGSCMVKDE